jgi:hypothetical protein
LQALAALSLEGVHFKACFADSQVTDLWVAELAHSLSRRYYPQRGFILGHALQIHGVHFRACFADSWVADSWVTGVLSIEGVHFRACLADSWGSFQGVLRRFVGRRFVGRGGTIHRGGSFQGMLCRFMGFISGHASQIRGSQRYYP